MKQANIHEIKEEILQLLEQQDEEGVFDPNVLKELTLDFKEKAINIIAYTKNLDLTIEAIDTAMEQLKYKKNVASNKKRRSTEFLQEQMEELGVKTVKDDIHKAVLTKSQMRVIVDENTVDKKWIKTAVTEKVDKIGIKKHIQETGEKVEGVTTVEGQHLRIS